MSFVDQRENGIKQKTIFIDKKMKEQKTFFTGCTHYGHAKIIQYCERPFKSIQEHDSALIKRFNSVVSPNDQSYILGDFAFKSKTNIHDIVEIFNSLNGKIFYIFGNHDKSLRKEWNYITRKTRGKVIFLGDYAEIDVGKQKIILCHYAFKVWNKRHFGSWNLYSHSHGTLPDDPHNLGIDVGVDCHNYYPIEFNQVKEIMAAKTYKPVDGHGSDLPLMSREEFMRFARKRLYEQLKQEFEGPPPT